MTPPGRDPLDFDPNFDPRDSETWPAWMLNEPTLRRTPPRSLYPTFEKGFGAPSRWYLQDPKKLPADADAAHHPAPQPGPVAEAHTEPALSVPVDAEAGADDEPAAEPAPPKEPDDSRISCVWIEPQRRYEDENERNLRAAARIMRAGGYRVVERREDGDGEVTAILALGRWSTSPGEPSASTRYDLAAAAGQFAYDGWDKLGLDSISIPVPCFRGEGVSDAQVEGGFLLQHSARGVEAEIWLPPDLWLRPDEPDAALLDKLPVLPCGWAEWEDVATAAGGSLEVFTGLLEAQREGDDPGELVPQLVEGLLPAGEVVGLVGETEAGKTTLAHQLAAALTAGAAEVLGYPIASPPKGARRSAVILAAEEGVGAINMRKNRFRAGGLAQGFLVGVERSGRTISEALEQIEGMPGLGLVILDPASAWIGEGDEDKAGAVSEFLELLRRFASRKGCCVLVLHHIRKLTKRGQRTRLVDLRTLARGSGVWIERPRVVLGLVKNPDGTRSFGVIKSNLDPLIPKHGIQLGSDPESSLSHRLGGALATRAKAAPLAAPGAVAGSDDAREVSAAVAALRAGNEVVRRSGGRSLFKLQPPALAGWSRDRIEKAVAAALSAGLLIENRRDGISPP